MCTKCFIVPSLHSTQSIQCQAGSSFGYAMVRMRSKAQGRPDNEGFNCRDRFTREVPVPSQREKNFSQNSTFPFAIHFFRRRGRNTTSYITSHNKEHQWEKEHTIFFFVIIKRRTSIRASVVWNYIYTVGGKMWTSLKWILITKQGHVAGAPPDRTGQQCGAEAREKPRALRSATGSLHLPHSAHQIWGAQRKFAVGSGSLQALCPMAEEQKSGTCGRVCILSQ